MVNTSAISSQTSTRIPETVSRQQRTIRASFRNSASFRTHQGIVGPDANKDHRANYRHASHAKLPPQHGRSLARGGCSSRSSPTTSPRHPITSGHLVVTARSRGSLQTVRRCAGFHLHIGIHGMCMKELDKFVDSARICGAQRPDFTHIQRVADTKEQVDSACNSKAE